MEYRAPIMSCAEASEFERRFFARGGFGEREAIRRAGRGIAEEFLREFDIGNSPRIIAIAGGGHNGADAIAAAVDAALAALGQPSVIIAETVKGKGISFMENQAGWHGKAPSAEEAAQALAELG